MQIATPSDVVEHKPRCRVKKDVARTTADTYYALPRCQGNDGVKARLVRTI